MPWQKISKQLDRRGHLALPEGTLFFFWGGGGGGLVFGAAYGAICFSSVGLVKKGKYQFGSRI